MKASGANPASYPMGIRGSLPGGKAAGAWSWPLPPSAEVKEWVELYLHSPNTPLWRGAQLKHRDNFTFTLTFTFKFTFSIEQKLKFTIQMQSFLIFLDLPEGIF
jgi:hypothetical protein